MFKDTLVKWNEVHVPTSFLAKTDPEHLFMARPTLSGKKTRVTVRGSFLEFKMLDWATLGLGTLGFLRQR